MSLPKQCPNIKHKLSAAFLICSILLACAITFSPVLKSGFVNWDDDTLLVKNPLVRSLTIENTIRIFRTPVIKIYCPLTIQSFAVEYHFFKLDPFIYHLNNLLLHLGIVWLVFLFATQLGLDTATAAFAALLFGIHPMHVESVAWVSERKDVLYAFFYMLSLNCYLKYLAVKKARFYALAVSLGLLSMLSKPMALSLPFIFYLCDWFKGRTFDRVAVTEKLWVFAYIIPIAWQTYILQTYRHTVNWYEEALKVIWIFIFYIKKFLLPFSLEMFYELPEPVSLANPAYFTAIAAFLLLIFLVIYFRRHKIFVFAGLFYTLSIFFVLRRVQEHSPGGVPFYSIENRFMYLASLGVCLLIGWGLARLLKFYSERGRLKFIMVSVIITTLFAALSLAAFVQCRNWTNSITLWSSVIAHNPDSAIAYNNRGNEQESDALALADYNKCIALDPNFIEAYFNRAGILSRMGEYQRAIADYTQTLRLNPSDAQAYYLRSQNYYKIGETEKALADAAKAESLGFRGPSQVKER